MSTIPGSENLVWSDEQTRFYLQLRIDEKVKGNIRKQNVNDAGRQSIIDKFHEEFGEKHLWKKFGSKYTSCKKQYEACKRVTRNRTGLGYNRDGSINMTDDWWNDRYMEWPGSRKLKEKPVPNMDLLEKVFGTCNVTGGEGWTAAQGEEHLDLFNRGGPPTNSRELFNRKHSSLRSVIERTFGVWKAKWRILDRKHPKYELTKWIKIVTATMALHNFIRDSQQEDSDFQHWEAAQSYELHGDGDGDGNGNHVPYIPAGDRFMEAMRDSITTQMAQGTRLPY